MSTEHFDYDDLIHREIEQYVDDYYWGNDEIIDRMEENEFDPFAGTEQFDGF